MAPHSSTLAWKIPWTEEPGRLRTMGQLSQKRLSNFTFTFHFPALQKAMATHSSVLAWRIPGTEEPGGLLWGRTESDTTEVTQQQQQQLNNQNFYLGGEQNFAGLLRLSHILLFYWAHTAFRTFFLGVFMIHCEVHWTCETCTDPQDSHCRIFSLSKK